MTLSPPAVMLGSQLPQISHLPPHVHSLDAAVEALELLESIGMSLDESQRFTLEAALGVRADQTWSAFEVCDIQPRQNGKGETIQARELVGLFHFGEQLIIHTAHEFPTANEAFLRMVSIIEANAELSRQVLRIRFANGEQGVELKSGARLKYRARTGGAGRGFAGAALVVYDEAYALSAEHIAASLPTLSTHPNPQVWFASSAGLSSSTALWALRKRALKGDAGRLAYIEHTAERISLEESGRPVSEPLDVDDERLVALANPAYGVRISADYIDAERRAMDAFKFARERLGVWDALADDLTLRDVKLPADKWAATVIPNPPVITAGRLVISFDIAKDGSWSSIAMASGDISNPYVEVIDHRPDSGWLADRLVELVERWQPIAVGCNGAGPAGAQVGPVLAAFDAAGIPADLLVQLNTQAYKQACGGLFTDVVEGRLRRPPNQGPLDVAAGDAAERPLGDAWAWDLRSATVPISPLVAVTVARGLLPVATAPAPVAPMIF